MASLEETRKQLAQLLEKANRLHHKGEFNQALKTYRQALELTTSKEKKAEIQVQINQAHDMLSFVQGTDEPEAPKLSELIKDWVSSNLFALAGAGILALLVLLGILLSPAFMYLLDHPDQQVSPQPEASEEPDVIIQADNDAAGVEMQGSKEDSGEGNTRKEKISIVTLTVPDSIYEPYPSKYIIKAPAPVYLSAEANKQPASAQLAINTQVLLVGKTENKTWLEIETPTKERFWIAAAYLGDSRFKTAAEIDAEIKASLGGKYWEIQAEGQTAPFTYYLYINAPQADLAYVALMEAYQFYASRQLLKLINTYSHSKTKSVRVQAQQPANLDKQPNPISVSILIYSQSGLDSNKKLGEKTIQIPRLTSGRYELRQQLEGY